MKKLFNGIGIIVVLAILLPILSGCSDDMEEQLQPDRTDWCGTKASLDSVTGVKGKVISTSDGYYILPLEPVKGLIRTDIPCLILAMKTNISEGVRLDLSEYIGQTITFDCRMYPLPPSYELMLIDEQKASVGIYYVQDLIIKDNKSRSGENTYEK